MGINEERILELERELRNLKAEKRAEEQIDIDKNIEKLLKFDWIDGHRVLLEVNTNDVVLEFIYMSQEIKDLIYHNITKRKSSERFFVNNKTVLVGQKSFKVEFRSKEDAISFIKDNRLSLEVHDRDYRFIKFTKEFNKINNFDEQEHDEWVERLC